MMIARIFDKLHDRKGVTILMALFAMLVASMVCIVILGAAVTSVKQETTDRTQEQLTLDLQSAGELIRAEIENLGDITLVYTNEETGSMEQTSATYQPSALSKELLDATDSILNGSETKTGGFAVSATNEAGQSMQQPVTVGYILKPLSQDEASASGTGAVTVTTNGTKSGFYQLIVTMSVDDPTSTSPQYLFLKCIYSCEDKTETMQKKVTVNTGDPKNPTKEETVYYDKRTATFKWNGSRFYLSEDVSKNG